MLSNVSRCRSRPVLCVQLYIKREEKKHQVRLKYSEIGLSFLHCFKVEEFLREQHLHITVGFMALPLFFVKHGKDLYKTWVGFNQESCRCYRQTLSRFQGFKSGRISRLCLKSCEEYSLIIFESKLLCPVQPGGNTQKHLLNLFHCTWLEFFSCICSV